MTRPGDPGHRWKRADVTAGMLLHAIDRFGVDALDILRTTQGIPAKVLIAAVHRDAARKLIDWGVSPWRPFLDTAGRQIVEEAKMIRHANSQGGRGRAAHMNEWSHTIENGMMVHKRGDSSTSHGTGTTCGQCPPLAQPVSTWKVVAEGSTSGQPRLERHEVSGTPDVVAAWLRAMAERLAPTRPVKRGGVPMLLDETWQGRGDASQGFDILPPPVH